MNRDYGLIPWAVWVLPRQQIQRSGVYISAMFCTHLSAWSSPCHSALLAADQDEFNLLLEAGMLPANHIRSVEAVYSDLHSRAAHAIR